MADGLHDLIHFPAVGLRTSPTAFALGIAQGMTSLMKKTVSSLCITASDFSESLQVGLIALGVVDPSLSSLELFSSSQYPAIKNVQNGNENEIYYPSALTVPQNKRNAPISMKATEQNDAVSRNKMGPQNALGNYRPRGGFEGVKQGKEYG